VQAGPLTLRANADDAVQPAAPLPDHQEPKLQSRNPNCPPAQCLPHATRKPEAFAISNWTEY